jgi:hypothetical protein
MVLILASSGEEETGGSVGKILSGPVNRPKPIERSGELLFPYDGFNPRPCHLVSRAL